MRRVSWVKAALKDFGDFPQAVQKRMKFALEIVAAGQFPDVAKPLKGFDAGVYEIAIPYRIDAYRTVYALKLDEDVWVVHAFQKKSTQGVKTPQREIDLIHTRIARIRSMLS